MKLLAYLKVSIKGIIKELPGIVLSYVAYPMILALIFGYIQQDDFAPTINQPIISISIVDEDNTESSHGLVSYLKSESISKLISIEDISKDSDYKVIIPDGYSLGIKGDIDKDIKVEASEHASTSRGNMLVNLIDNYNRELAKAILIERNIQGLNIDKEELSRVLTRTYNSSSIDNEKYLGEKTLTSYEYSSISFLGFIFILFIIAIITSEGIGKEIGLYHRIMSTGLTKIEYFNLELAQNYMMMLVINTIYIFGFRIFGLSFTGNIPILILIILMQSLIITLIGSLISSLFSRKYGTIIAQVYLMFHMIFGGGIGSPETFQGIKIFDFFAKYKPDILISDTYRNFLIYNDFQSISKYLLMIVGFSIVAYLVNIIVVEREWGIK